MKNFIWILTLLLVIIGMAVGSTAGQAAMTKLEKVNVDNLVNSFIAAYQAGNVDEITGLYAPAAKMGGRSFSRQDIKQQYRQSFGKNKDMIISGITVVQGKDSFKMVDPNKAIGTLKLRVSYTKGGQTKSFDTNLNLTLTKSEGPGAWSIIETSKFTVMDDAPAEGH